MIGLSLFCHCTEAWRTTKFNETAELLSILNALAPQAQGDDTRHAVDKNYPLGSRQKLRDVQMTRSFPLHWKKTQMLATRVLPRSLARASRHIVHRCPLTATHPYYQTVYFCDYPMNYLRIYFESSFSISSHYVSSTPVWKMILRKCHQSHPFAYISTSCDLAGNSAFWVSLSSRPTRPAFRSSGEVLPSASEEV
jgi:hypothetical protein